MPEVRTEEFTYTAHSYISEREKLVVPASDPCTAQELLHDCIELLTRPCRRPHCGEAQREAATARGLKDQLGRVTAERDALERLLIRKTDGYHQ